MEFFQHFSLSLVSHAQVRFLPNGETALEKIERWEKALKILFMGLNFWILDWLNHPGNSRLRGYAWKVSYLTPAERTRVMNRDLQPLSKIWNWERSPQPLNHLEFYERHSGTRWNICALFTPGFILAAFCPTPALLSPWKCQCTPGAPSGRFEEVQ